MEPWFDDCVRRVWETEAQEVSRLSGYVDLAVAEQVMKLMGDCQGKVVVTACGTSAAAAKKVVHSLSVIDVPAVFLVPSDAVHGSLGILRPEDVVVIISKGGNTAELTRFLPNVQGKGATIVGVGENPNSAIGRASDVFLKVKIEREPDEFNMLATASTMAVIAVFDAICIALMRYRGFTLDAFALNHPQGAVGERLAQGSRSR